MRCRLIVFNVHDVNISNKFQNIMYLCDFNDKDISYLHIVAYFYHILYRLTYLYQCKIKIQNLRKQDLALLIMFSKLKLDLYSI